MNCRVCGHGVTYPHGKTKLKRQRFFCPNCRHTFVAPIKIRYWLSLSALLAFGGGAYLFFSGRLIVAGVPSPILLEFLQDERAMNAYVDRDLEALHDRLKALGVEEQMKAFYRPKIDDEKELDRHIHQIMFDRTGYVGDSYVVDSRGKLVLHPKLRKKPNGWENDDQFGAKSENVNFTKGP
jgi:hypothetical protein